jgi:hypothetical protein
MSTYATGGNYRIELVRTIAWLRVWRRPDLTHEQGAALAREKVAILSRLAEGPRSMAKALLIDLRSAPRSWGPITQSALDEILSAWELAQRRTGVLLADDPVQEVLLRPSLRRSAPSMGRSFLAEADALDYCILGRVLALE